MKHQQVFSLTTIALSAAILALLAPFSVPLGVVPITLQTLIVGLLATILKARESFFAILLYLISGFIGLPVFTGGASGISVLFGATGGFLGAFLIVGTLISYVLEKLRHQIVWTFVVNLIGFVIMLLIGTIGLKFLTHAAWPNAFSLGFLPFLPIELFKALIASFFGLSIFKALGHTNKYFTN